MLKVAILAALACACYASGPQLNDLRIRFGMFTDKIKGNPYFIQVPRSTPQTDNYTAIGGSDCVKTYTRNGNTVVFYGRRYQPINSDNKQETTFVSLYDIQGSIAGVQACWPMSMLTEDNDLEVESISSYQIIEEDGQEFACQTAYFIPPSKICTEGRSAEQVQSEGTVTELSFQWGLTPEDRKIAPANRADAAGQKWSLNNCFDKMGFHNFHDVESYSKTECRQLHGYFLLYDLQGRLIGFGFRFEGEPTSTYAEKPPATAVKIIQGCAPTCIVERTNKFTTATMHVYFISDPSSISCGVSKNFWNVWYARQEDDSANCPNTKAPWDGSDKIDKE